MVYEEKIEGQTCPACQGKYVKSPKTGKVFCENKCWLKGQETSQPAYAPKPINPTVEVDWDKIAEGKTRHGFALEAYKMGKTLDVTTATEINKWVAYVMSGKIGNQPVDATEPPAPVNVPFDS